MLLSVGKWIAGKVIGTVAGKAVDAVAKPSIQRGLQQVLRLALTDLAQDFPKLQEHFHSIGAWELLLQAVQPLLSREGRVDVEALVVRIREESANPPDDLKAGLERLIRLVHDRLTKHPGLAVIETIRLTDQVRLELAALASVLTGPTNPDDIVAACRGPASEIVDGFMRGTRVTDAALPRLTRSKSRERVDFATIAQLLAEGTSVIVEGEPGIGKTTLLLSLARVLPAFDDQAAAIYVFLPDWAASDGDLFSHIVAQRGFQPPLSPPHLRLLAMHGRLTLLLDGWNELSGDRLERADRELASLGRQYPLLGMVIGTRSTAQVPPLDRFLHIETGRLSEHQRQNLVCDHLPARQAEAFLEHLSRVPALDDITRIPLYLVTALDVAGDGDLPGDKESVIASAATKIDRVHRLELAKLEGHHRQFMTALSVRMFDTSTSLSEDEAKNIVSDELRLIQRRQVACTSVSARDIVGLLVGHHLIMSAGAQVRFQHQLFQEWFASWHVESLARQGKEAEQGLIGILNVVAWGEAIGFAVERLAKQEAGIAAHIIVKALTVDPVFAAELVRRGGDAVWAHLGGRFTEFAHAWHQPQKIDRALTFMIASGRQEFAETLRPFFGHMKDQIQLKALRLYSPLPASCLGEDWESWYLGLHPDTRRVLVSDSISLGRIEPLSFALELAATEPNPDIVVDIIHALDWRGAHRLIRAVLDGGGEAVWQALANTSTLETFDDPDYLSRRRESLRARAAAASDPIATFNILSRLANVGEQGLDDWVRAAIADDTLPFDNREAGPLLAHAMQLDPASVGNQLARRLIAGEKFWFDPATVEGLPDEQPQDALAEWLLENLGDSSYEDRLALSLLGKEALKKLCGACLDGSLEERHLWPARAEPLAEAIMDCAPQTAREAATLLGILAAMGRHDRADPRLNLPTDVATHLGIRIRQWLSLPGDDMDMREVHAEAALLLGRIGAIEDVHLIGQLLEQEVAAIGDPKARFIEWHRSGQKGPDPRCIPYFQHYREACEALHCPEMASVIVTMLRHAQFAIDAAGVLLNFYRWEQMAAGVESPFGANGSPDYTIAARRQLAKAAGEGRQAAHPYAEAVLEEIARLRDSDNPSLAKDLAARVAGLGYGDRYEEILEALELPSKTWAPSADGYVRLVLAGETLPVEPLIVGYEATMDVHRKYGQEWHTLTDWLKVMMFSDHPGEAFSRIRQLVTENHHLWELAGVISTLGHAPDKGATQLLLDIALAHPNLVQNPSWAIALSSRADDTSAKIRFGILSNGVLCESLQSYTFNNPLLRKIAGDILDDAHVRGLYLALLAFPPSESSCTILAAMAEYISEQSRDDELLIAALNLLPAQWGTPIWASLSKAVEYRVIGREHAGGNVFNLVPSAAPQLRAALLRMAYTDAMRADCARTLLLKIDDWRDEYGWPVDEPRHPDVRSGLDWPPLLRQVGPLEVPSGLHTRAI